VDWEDCGVPGILGSHYGLHYSAGLWMIADLTRNQVQTSGTGTGDWASHATDGMFVGGPAAAPYT
jgi:hypothetical protein